MIDIEKAREAFKKITISHEMMAYHYNYYLNHIDSGYQVCVNPTWENELDNIKQALTELERLQKKEIPMKLMDKRIYNPKEKSDITTGCPKCESICVSGKYCHDCGQKLDWSDENE